MKIVFLFSGQGSHYRGMGKSLFEGNAYFRNSIEESEAIIQKHLNRSLIDELYYKQEKTFDDLLITHPAIVAIEIAMYRTLHKLGIHADFVSGNSLGEFAAAVASEIWSEEMALEAAIEQAKGILRADINGGMVTVLNTDQEDLHPLVHQMGLYLAADNFDTSFSVAGTSLNLDAFQEVLKKRNIQYVRLSVIVPFHSPLLDEAKNDFQFHMENEAPLATPCTKFISGIKYQGLNKIPADYFWDVVSTYNNFPKLVKHLEENAPCLYIDLGPSGTSANFVKYNLPSSSSSQVFSIMTPFKRGLQQLEKLLQKLKTD